MSMFCSRSDINLWVKSNLWLVAWKVSKSCCYCLSQHCNNVIVRQLCSLICLHINISEWSGDNETTNAERAAAAASGVWFGAIHTVSLSCSHCCTSTTKRRRKFSSFRFAEATSFEDVKTIISHNSNFNFALDAASKASSLISLRFSSTFSLHFTSNFFSVFFSTESLKNIKKIRL